MLLQTVAPRLLPADSLPFLGSEIVPGMRPRVLTAYSPTSSQPPAADTHHICFSKEDLRLQVRDAPGVTQLVADPDSRACTLLGKK